MQWRPKFFFEFHALSAMPHRIAELVVVAQKDAHASGSCVTSADFTTHSS